jgi:hypothetical protein
MKVKWRLHERMLVTWMAVLVIAVSLARGSGKDGLPGNQISFLVSYAVALSALVLYGAYWWLNLLVIPMGVKAVKIKSYRWLRIIGVLFQFLFLGYLLGPGVNFASFYGGFTSPRFGSFPLTLGSHPQPFLNCIGGLDVALAWLWVYLSYATYREWLIYTTEKMGDRGIYWMMISNTVTRFAVNFFALPFVTALFHLIKTPVFYHYYFALAPPVLLSFLTANYWLFPRNEGNKFLNRRFVWPVLLSTLAYSVAFSIFLQEDRSIITVLASWAAQLYIFIPLSWLYYKKQRDNILPFHHMQRSLIRSKADLALLRSQINPHFLFNALNSLYATALREKSADTATGIQQLGDMMRFMLHDNQQDEIPMEREIEYLGNYVALQKLRVTQSEDMVIAYDVDADNCSFQLAPMLLIPFVENAFKHGISLQEKSWIKIKLSCEDRQLKFEVRNSVHEALVNDPEKENSGIGLQNVRERLHLFYKGRYELNYGVEGKEFMVNLTIKTK